MTDERLSRCVDSTHWAISAYARRPSPRVPYQFLRHTLVARMQRCPIRRSGKVVLNLASMTEPNLIDDSPKMSDATQLECGAPLGLRAHSAVLRIALALGLGKTVSYRIQRRRNG